MEPKPKVGLAMCGSYCTYEQVFAEVERLRDRLPENALIAHDARHRRLQRGQRYALLLRGQRQRPVP